MKITVYIGNDIRLFPKNITHPFPELKKGLPLMPDQITETVQGICDSAKNDENIVIITTSAMVVMQLRLFKFQANDPKLEIFFEFEDGRAAVLNIDGTPEPYWPDILFNELPNLQWELEQKYGTPNDDAA